jgi:hypothetical protein
MGNCCGGGAKGEKQPLIKKIGGHEKDEGGGCMQEDIEGEAWTDVPKRSCIILPGSTYRCPYDIIAWRTLLFVSSLYLLLWSILDHAYGINDDNIEEPLKNPEVKYWFIYLTHWILMTETAYFFTALATLLAAVISQDPERKRMQNAKPWFMSLTFGLQSIVLPFSFIITLMYWTLVFPTVRGSMRPLSVMTHGGNFAVIFVDFVLGQQPMFFSKILWPLVFASVYGIFTLVYYYNGGTTESGSRNIYEIIDWSDPRGVATVYGVIYSALIVAWFLFYGIWRVIHRFCGPPPLKG